MNKKLIVFYGILFFTGVYLLRKKQGVDNSQNDYLYFNLPETNENININILETPQPEYIYFDIPNDKEESIDKELTVLEKIKSFFTKVLTLQEIDSILMNNNIRAFLKLIRFGEGTNDDAGYSRIFGGDQFYSFNDHPRILVKTKRIKSTAAGAYQILSRTWDDIKNSYPFLMDFSPTMQDRAAIALIHRRGAVNDILDGKFNDAIAKTNKEWASLPGSPYGQPTLTFDRANRILAQNGAQIIT